MQVCQPFRRTAGAALPRLALLAAVLALSGCVGYQCWRIDVPTPEVGDARSTVVATFGEPAESRTDGSGRTDVYQFRYEECSGFATPVPLILVLPLWGGSDAFWTVGYGINGRVLSVDSWPEVENVDDVLARAAKRRARIAATRASLTVRAQAGDPEAAISLARDFGERGPLLALAEAGEPDVIYYLAKQSGELGALKELAEAGDPTAAYYMYEEVLSAGGDSWEWLCRAANAGHSRAQFDIGSLYWYWSQAPEHRAMSYMWTTFASESGLDAARAELNELREALTESEMSMGMDMVRAWAPGPCPNPR